MKRCFVISPIRAAGSTERDHADKVFSHIIKPAMKQVEFEPYRGDQYLAPGKISQQVLRSILTEDFCIAVLTGHNPNVFYELAVAQCAMRPVIMMIHKEEEPPFDVADYRCIQYDFDPDALADGTYVSALVSHVRALEADGWVVPALLPELPDPSPRIPNAVVAKDNSEVTAKVRRYLKAQREAGKPVQSAKVIQFSGANATELVRLLVEAGINVDLYLGDVKFPKQINNQHQADRVVNNRFSKLKNEVLPNGLKPGVGQFRLFRYDAPASLRAVLIDDGFVAVGSYVYMKKDIEGLVLDIRGREMPMFVVQAGHPDFLAVSAIVKDTIENWANYQVTSERNEHNDFADSLRGADDTGPADANATASGG